MQELRGTAGANPLIPEGAESIRITGPEGPANRCQIRYHEPTPGSQRFGSGSLTPSESRFRTFLFKYSVTWKCWSFLGMRTIPRGVQCPTHTTGLQLGMPCHRVGVCGDRATDSARRRINQAATR